MTAPPAGALEACLALLEKATRGEWEVVQGDEWTTDIGTPEGEYEAGRKRHWNVASVNRRRDEWEANRQLIAAAVNLLRTHGPALLAALRLREAVSEWRFERLHPTVIKVTRAGDVSVIARESAGLNGLCAEYALYGLADDLARALEQTT